MDDRNIRRFESTTCVQIFGSDNAADFAPGSKATTLFLELDPIVLELTDARVGHLRGPVGKPVLIDALSTDFKDIARTSRAIKLDDPTFPDGDYRHPATAVETTVTTHADSLLKILEDNPADGGDTPAQLDACNSGKHSDNFEGVESTSAIDTLLGDAQAIITRLDAAIQNKYSRDPDKLAAWKSASRTERPAKKAEATTPPPVN